MSLEIRIVDVHGREILDSRGNPTVEVEITAQTETNGRKTVGRESVPSGASTGQFEAIELRDGDKKYFGLGVQKVVDHINARIKNELVGMNVLDQVAIDRKLIELDGTDNKGNLGANAILGVSLACARCAAAAMELPLYRYLGGINAKVLPRPMMNVINGGVHAKNKLDFQEFMIIPFADNYCDALRMGAEVYHFLKKILEEDGMYTAVGDEGGFAPDLTDAKAVFTYLKRAVEKAGYQVGVDFAFAMDAAASELYDEKTKRYVFKGEGKERDREEMIALYEELVKEFPLISIEDGLDEEDWEGWKEFTARMSGQTWRVNEKEEPQRVMLVGDDLFVTNTKRIRCGIGMSAGNAVLIKVNQIGTVTEAMDAIACAQLAGYKAVISHRSGETEDAFIADLAVAVNAGWIKTGAPCRGERTAKYNALLRIAEQVK